MQNAQGTEVPLQELVLCFPCFGTQVQETFKGKSYIRVMAQFPGYIAMLQSPVGTTAWGGGGANLTH